MPRLARLIVPGVALHVVQRGHDRQACFREDTDHLVYLVLLRDCLAKTRCALHAYCLMTNHVHLLITPPDASACATLMRSLGQCYVQYFNRRYQRSGTLWEGRFRSCLVDSERYVLACYRYIELNPVRAGMVDRAAAYRWSSHQGNVGSVDDGLLTPHAEYAGLAHEEARRHFAYRQLFAAGDDPAFLAEVREATSGGFPLLGSEMKSRLGGMSIRRLERRKPGPAPAEERGSAETPSLF